MKEMIEQIENRLSIFKDIYSYIRIVNPIEKISYTKSQENDKVSKIKTESCYNFWQTNKQCSNCISMRAYNNNKSVVKIEMKNGKIYYIQAFPLNINKNKVIVEMIKDITEDGIIMAENNGETVDLNEYINVLNSKLIIDELTGIYNRRYIQERLPSDLYKARVMNKSMAIVMADIDYFKNVNDIYGHLAGDYVLREFSLILKNSIRDSMDWVARYGGEEFIIVLNQVGKNQAIKIIEKIRKKVENQLFTYEQNDIRITCSFGINVLENSTYDFDEIIKISDECLIEAKKKGRNQIVVNK